MFEISCYLVKTRNEFQSYFHTILNTILTWKSYTEAFRRELTNLIIVVWQGSTYASAIYIFTEKMVFTQAKNPQLTEYTTVAPWCSGYHYCTSSFNEAWTRVLRRLKPCSRRVGDSRWWGSLTMVPAGNKAKRLSSVNHSTKAIHHHQNLSVSLKNNFAKKNKKSYYN